MKVDILEILHSYSNINDIEDISSKHKYEDRYYGYIFKFNIIIENLIIAIVMGIPKNWDRKLIDIYIVGYDKFKYIPHIGKNGLVCLFDLEGVLIEGNFNGLLKQTLDRLIKILYDGINDLNKNDFIEEFEQYWGRLPKSIFLKSMIKTTKNIKLIKYIDNKKRTKKKKEKYIDILKEEKTSLLIASDLEEDFSVYSHLDTVRNGIYVYIESEEYIYPPDWRDNLDIEYINDLLRHKNIDPSNLKNYIKKCKGDLVVIFNIQQPNGCKNIFGVIIKDSNILSSEEAIVIQDYKDLIPCMVLRCDKEFLINRGGAFSDIQNKRVLVIGCGSIGSYFISELVKTGIANITIVDEDILNEENIYRHLLGMEYVGLYKTVAIKKYIDKNIPNVNVICLEENIECAVESGDISLMDYDLIISATGNHNVNRWINNYIYQNKFNIPVIYLWNEVLGIGSHGAFITLKNKGCFECFIGNGDQGIYDKTSYCEIGQLFTKKVRGCGTSFLPFGSIHSLKTVSIGIEMAMSYFTNRLTKNIIISLKGDDYYFKREGLRTSDRYNNQKGNKNMILGSQFTQRSCICCGGK